MAETSPYSSQQPNTVLGRGKEGVGKGLAREGIGSLRCLTGVRLGAAPRRFLSSVWRREACSSLADGLNSVPNSRPLVPFQPPIRPSEVVNLDPETRKGSVRKSSFKQDKGENGGPSIQLPVWGQIPEVWVCPSGAHGELPPGHFICDGKR